MGRPKKPVEDWKGQIHIAEIAPKARKAEPEASVLARVKAALARVGGVHVMPNRLTSRKMQGRWVSFGLGKGSSDLVAIVAPYGRWLCIETKKSKGGIVSDDQKSWLAMMERYGAVVGVCTTPEQALELVVKARRPAFEDEVA